MIDLKLTFIGLLVGFLVGLSGMGGGALMTPILIIFLKIKPVIAVATDLFYISITKIFGAVQHSIQRTVNFRIIKYLALGSVPAAFLGTQLVRVIENNLKEKIDIIISQSVGLVLILVALVLFFSFFIETKPIKERIFEIYQIERRQNILMIILGIIGGFIVSITSVGAGSLMIVFILLFNRISLKEAIGTDVFQGALLALVASLGYLFLGKINFALAFNLLLGSIPGVLIGAKATKFFPRNILKSILTLLLAILGIKLLYI